jgi:hypothetical protein
MEFRSHRSHETIRGSKQLTVEQPIGVVSSRAWQGARISTGGMKIGVTAFETRMAKPRLAGLTFGVDN